MPDHSKNGVQALINALELVAPAVDPADPIALEQLQSAVRYLGFLRDRLDHLYDRERFELRHHLDMTDRLLATPSVDGERRQSLAAQCAEGHALLRRVGANVPEMRARTAALAALIASTVHGTATASEPGRSELRRIILDATAERIAFERAWYLPLGFDHSPGEVPDLAHVLERERAIEAARLEGAASR